MPWPAYLGPVGVSEKVSDSEGTVPSDLSTAAGNTVASGSQLGPPNPAALATQMVHHHESQDCSDS